MRKLLIFCIIVIDFYPIFAQNSVGIGTESPNARAVLELVSPTSNQGLLVPRLTTAQRTAAAFVNALTQAENGLMVYDTNLNAFFYWQTSAWQLVSGLQLSAGENITISPTGVVSAQFLETQNLTLTENILSITNNVDATPIDLTPYLNIQTATQVAVTPNANLLATNVQAALEELQTELLTTTVDGMQATVYDPANISGNAFDLAIHTGNLPNTRITGLGTASTFDAGTALGNLVQVGPNGLPAIDGSLLTGLSMSQFGDLGDLAALNAVGTEQITNNTILNEDISPAALIAGTKVVPNFGPQNLTTSGSITGSIFIGDGSGLSNIGVPDGTITGGTGLGAKIATNTITNDNISTTAAIAGAKVNPAFGAQNISTTGTLNAGAITATSFTGNGAGLTGITGATVNDASITGGTGLGAKIATNTITNDNISATAAILGTKVDPNFGTQNLTTSGSITGGTFTGDGSGLTGVSVPDGTITGGTGTGAKIAATTITNDNISATAAIEGTKIAPNFGTQNIITTGTITSSTSKLILTNPASTDTAFTAKTYSNQLHGYAISGIHEGTGDAAGFFLINNPASTFPALYAETRGTAGIGVMGTVATTATGHGGVFSNFNSTNNSPVVLINTAGTAPALRIEGGMELLNGSEGLGKVLVSDAAGLATWQEATGTSWGITGNAGMVDGTNFIGTTDAIPLHFKVNSQNVGKLDNSGNIFFGLDAGLNNTETDNTFIGSNSGQTNTTGNLNAFYGSGSGANNTIGSSNSFLGFWAGLENTTGNQNTFVGHSAGRSNTTANNNTFVGASAGVSNTIGSENSFFGRNTGVFNTTGASNSFFGFVSGYFNTTGLGNSSFGFSAGSDNTTGNYNTTMGYQAANLNTIGGNNTIVGAFAGQNNTVGGNSFYGYNSGRDNTTGGANSFFGLNSGLSNTTGFGNTYFGDHSGANNTTGNINSFFGYQAGQSNSGNSNAFFGESAGSFNTSGSDNSFFGNGTGFTNTTGSQVTLIGRNANVGAAGLTNATAIGANAIVGASNALVLGGTGVNAVNVGIGTIAPSQRLHVAADVNADGYIRVEAGDGTSTYSGILLTERGINYGMGIRHDAGSGNLFVGTVNPTPAPFEFNDLYTFTRDGRFGVARLPITNILEIEGDASKTTAGSWLANSDRRIKTDIRDIDNSLQLIKSLRPVKFKYTEEWMAAHPSIKNQYYYNFIAQEYQEVFPESVQQSGEYLDNDNESILQIDTYNAQIASIRAVQLLIEKVEQLEDEVGTLQAENAKLKSNQQAFRNQSDQLKSLAAEMNELKLLVQGKGKENSTVIIGQEK